MSVAESIGPYSGRRRPSNGLDYPVRFFNMMHFDMPKSHREILHWCEKFYRSSGFVRDTIDKLSRYPVTPVTCTGDESDSNVLERWNDILNNQLNIAERIVTINLHKNTFGNAFVSIIPLFRRYLKCKHCSSYTVHPIEKMKYTFREFKFFGKCKACEKSGEMLVKDEYKKDAEGDMSKQIRVKVWPTRSIHVKTNNVTGDSRITYKLSHHEIKGIRNGDTFYLETMPKDFIDAVRDHGDKAGILLDNDKTMWFKSEDLEDADNDHGMSLPFFFSSWKTLWQIFIHRKAQECIVSDHLLPYRVIYPTMQSASQDPISMIDLGQWKQSVGGMIQRWYNDPNEIGELPFPVGFQQLGGQGKAMSLNPEIEQLYRMFLIENGIPAELIFGGMSWSGSSVTLRMLENRFLYDVGQDNVFLKRLVAFIAQHFRIKAPKDVKMTKFKMADDIAKINVYASMNAQKKISNQRFLGILGDGIVYTEEAKIIESEKPSNTRVLIADQVSQAEAAGEGGRVSQLEQVKTQIESQDLMQRLQGVLGGHLESFASIMTPEGLARYAMSLPEDQRAQQLESLQATNPTLYQQMTQTMGAGDPNPVKQVELPTQKPPRSEGANARI